MNTTGGLIGRGEVLAVLRASFDQAASGQGHLVLIGGEAGIGKTAVAVAAADQAAATGALVLWGRCSESEGGPAFLAMGAGCPRRGSGGSTAAGGSRRAGLVRHGPARRRPGRGRQPGPVPALRRNGRIPGHPV